jgi:hypothetical protein
MPMVTGAHIGMTTIAAMTGIQRRNVPRSIHRLEKLGILRRERRVHLTGSPDSNFYIIEFECREEVSAPTRSGVLNNEDRGVSSAMRTGVLKSMSGGVFNAEDQNNSIEHTRSILHRPAARSTRAHARECQTGGEDGANSKFDAFWQIYPHRGRFSDPKKPAQRKFEAAIKRGIDPAAIIAGAERYRAHVEQEGIEPRFVAQAATWLHQERWAQFHEPEAPRLKVGMN